MARRNCKALVATPRFCCDTRRCRRIGHSSLYLGNNFTVVDTYCRCGHHFRSCQVDIAVGAKLALLYWFCTGVVAASRSRQARTLKLSSPCFRPTLRHRFVIAETVRVSPKHFKGQRLDHADAGSVAAKCITHPGAVVVVGPVHFSGAGSGSQFSCNTTASSCLPYPYRSCLSLSASV